MNEYREAAHWYNEREPLLALKFVDEVESTIRGVLDDPKRFRVVDEDVRRCLTHVFPYAVLYTIEHSFVLNRCSYALCSGARILEESPR